MNYDSDEDITSSSIYDLDHAPPPPPQPAWTGTLMRGGSLSPVPTKTRKNIALPHGDNHSLSSSHTRESTSSRPTQRRHATFSGSASFSDINRFSSGSHNSSTPGRRRSYSQSSLPTSSSSVPNLNMLHGRSFPPDGKEPTNRKVAFANTRDHFSEPGMLHPPGMEEVKEEEEDAIGGKINLSGTEIDEVQSKPENKQLRSDSPSTPWSDYSEANGDEDYTENGDLNSVEISSKQPITMLGFKLPMWCSKRRISWNRVATCVVEKAPCFLCVRMKQVLENPYIVQRSVPTATVGENEVQRNAEFLTIVWNLNGPVLFLGTTSGVVLLSITLTVRVIRDVNLAGAIRYLWVLLWVIPMVVYSIIGLFDYFKVTEVWIRFWWRDKTMAWFRRRFCNPSEYANEQCAVPVYITVSEETQWCQDKYGSANCVAIRDAAQNEMELFINRFYDLNAICAICFVLLLFLVIKTLESIISLPLVQKSREANVPFLLLLPTVGCVACGSFNSFSSASVFNARTDTNAQASWIGPVFLGAGGFFFVAAMLAWFLRAYPILNSRDKRRKSLAILGFMLMSVSLIIIFSTIFSACIVYSLSLEAIPIPDDLRGAIACFIDRSGSCTGCQNTTSRCPEWSNEDVTKILQSQAKSGASLAAICLIYAVNCLRYGANLRTHISNYMIDYV